MAFDPPIGGEIKKTRPAVIVSSDHANRVLNRVTVVPLTSATGRLYATEAVISLSGRSSKAMADQIRTMSKVRFGAKMGAITSAAMQDLERAIRVHLDLG